MFESLIKWHEPGFIFNSAVDCFVDDDLIHGRFIWSWECNFDSFCAASGFFFSRINGSFNRVRNLIMSIKLVDFETNVGSNF